MIIEKFNGNKLKAIREFRFKSIKEIEKETKISISKIYNYEDGSLKPNTENILTLSKVFKVPKSYFMKKDNLDVNMDYRYYAFHQELFKGQQESHVQRIKFAHEIFSFLELYITIPKLDLPQFDSKISAKLLAQNLRIHWGLEDNPIYNMTNLLESRGFIILPTYKKNNNIFAVERESAISKKIFIGLADDKKSITRRNYCLTYILGKIMINDKSKVNEFVEEFLLPKESFLTDLKSITEVVDLIEIKANWVVPMNVILSRLYDLDYISLKKYNYLKNEMNKLGWDKKEPLDDAKSTKPTLSKTCIDLLIENKIFNKAQLLKSLNENALNLFSEDIEEILGLKKGFFNLKDVGLTSNDIKNIKKGNVIEFNKSKLK